jgi:hypothetical protein
MNLTGYSQIKIRKIILKKQNGRAIHTAFASPSHTPAETNQLRFRQKRNKARISASTKLRLIPILAFDPTPETEPNAKKCRGISRLK